MTFLDKANFAFSQDQGAGSPQGPDDLFRRMMEALVQAGVEREFERHMGAERWQRTPERRGWRNGSKRRRLKTRVGTIELRVPQDRHGRFQPSVFERYQRSEKALVAALIMMYLQGVSTRRVTKIVEQLCGFSISASQVSALVKTLDDELEAWRSRSLAGPTYRYLVVDAHYEKVRVGGRVRSTAVLWVTGINEDGYREHLGVWLGGSESRETWSRVFQGLVRRGLSGVEYVVSDEHAGLCESIKRYFPQAEHQRCQVHYLRNAYSYTSSPELQREIKSALHDVWEARDRSEAEARLARFIDSLRKRHARLAAWLEETAHETLSFFALRWPTHRRRLRTTNSMEHDHDQVRRRTRVVRIFPNEESLLRLTSALAIERNEQWCERRYLMMEAETRNGEITNELKQSA